MSRARSVSTRTLLRAGAGAEVLERAAVDLLPAAPLPGLASSARQARRRRRATPMSN